MCNFSMKSVMNILIFKTNIKLKKDLRIVKAFLTGCTSIIQWNVDRQDADNILRVISTINEPLNIIKTINEAGYQCEELAD